MNPFRRTRRAEAFRAVLGFTFDHWRRQPPLIAAIVAAVVVSTFADVLVPVYAGRLVDAVALDAGDRAAARDAALSAFAVILALGAGMALLRHLAFVGIVRLTLRMMSDIAADAFHRVQRFSTEWHANSFAGSTVRKITRGMWALDLLNDTILIALLPSLVVLVGSAAVLAFYWPAMGLVVIVGTGALRRHDGGAVARLCGAGRAACQPVGHARRRRARRRDLAATPW